MDSSIHSLRHSPHGVILDAGASIEPAPAAKCKTVIRYSIKKSVTK